LALGGVWALLFLVAIWPGAALKLSLVKITGFHLYRVGRGEEYAETLQHFSEHLSPILPLLMLCLLSAAYLVWKCRSDSSKWGPFLVVGLLYGVSMIRFVISPQYLVPALAPLLCLVGLAAYRVGVALGPYFRAGLTALAVVLVFPPIWPGAARAQMQRENQSRSAEISWLGNILRGQEALVDGGHIYQHYLGPAYAIRPITVAYDGKQLLVRSRGIYQPLGRQDLEGKLIVIQNDRERFFSGPLPRIMLWGCVEIERSIFHVYDCSKAES
jgi:hypothetical protein